MCCKPASGHQQAYQSQATASTDTRKSLRYQEKNAQHTLQSHSLHPFSHFSLIKQKRGVGKAQFKMP